MMTGYDYQKLQSVVSNCESLELFLSVTGDKFKIQNKYGHNFGHFDNMDEVYAFINGYGTGFSMGKVATLAEPAKLEEA